MHLLGKDSVSFTEIAIGQPIAGLQKMNYSLKILQIGRLTACVQLINVQDPVHKNESDNNDPVTISNFPEKLAQNQYVCITTQNNSSLSNISSTLVFSESFKATA